MTSPYGPALGTGDGRVVYAWDKESNGVPACLDAACVQKWPPVLADTATAGAGVDGSAITIVARPDGTKQVALGGKRLYNMMIDQPGEANCQGGDGWWILHPDGTKNTNQTAVK